MKSGEVMAKPRSDGQAKRRICLLTFYAGLVFITGPFSSQFSVNQSSTSES